MRKVLLVVAAVLVAGLGVLVALWPAGNASVDSDKTETAGGSAVEPAGVAEKTGRRPVQNAVRKSSPSDAESDSEEVDDDDEEESRRTPEERKLADDIDKALDEEDFELAKKCAPLALACKDVEIRQSMVDTLAWFDEKAIPELTPFIADPNEDVASSALNAWDSAVSSVENEPEKISMVEMAMKVLSDEDGLESLSAEYIGVDEKLAVESLVRVIEGSGNPKGVAKAKETYEFVTGDAFTDRAAAEKWIAEEYTPPEGEGK